MHPRQAPQRVEETRQFNAQAQGQKVFGAPPLGVERTPLNPRAKHAPLMTGRSAQVA
jgi:hypothetical protein